MTRIDAINTSRSQEELEGVRWAASIGATPPFTQEEQAAFATRMVEIQKGRA